MYSLFDNKIDAYGVPMAFRNEDEARKELAYFLENQDHTKINPIDYEIFYIGEFDTNSGKYNLPEKPEHIINCKQIISHLEKATKIDGVTK